MPFFLRPPSEPSLSLLSRLAAHSFLRFPSRFPASFRWDLFIASPFLLHSSVKPQSYRKKGFFSFGVGYFLEIQNRVSAQLPKILIAMETRLTVLMIKVAIRPTRWIMWPRSWTKIDRIKRRTCKRSLFYVIYEKKSREESTPLFIIYSLNPWLQPSIIRDKKKKEERKNKTGEWYEIGGYWELFNTFYYFQITS